MAYARFATTSSETGALSHEGSLSQDRFGRETKSTQSSEHQRRTERVLWYPRVTSDLVTGRNVILTSSGQDAVSQLVLSDGETSSNPTSEHDSIVPLVSSRVGLWFSGLWTKRSENAKGTSPTPKPTDSGYLVAEHANVGFSLPFDRF